MQRVRSSLVVAFALALAGCSGARAVPVDPPPAPVDAHPATAHDSASARVEGPGASVASRTRPASGSEIGDPTTDVQSDEARAIAALPSPDANVPGAPSIEGTASETTDDRPRVVSVGMTSWIRKRPRMNERELLGYVRTGSSVPVASLERVPGEGCPRGFYRVLPRGFLCADRTVSEAPPVNYLAAARATLGKPGAFPYRYAISDGAPMYNRVPSREEQARIERFLGEPGKAPRLPKTLRSHEELARAERIDADGAIPPFFEARGSGRMGTFDLVEQMIPLGSMLSFTRSFEAEGRTWLLSPDHTLVPADRVRPFAPSAFAGVELGPKGARLPIAWMRARPRPRFVERDGRLVEDGAFPLRSYVELTGTSRVVEGTTYLEIRTSGPPAAFVRASDATVVEPETKLGTGVKPGQKWVVVRLTRGTLVAYEGLTPVFATLVSPGAGGVPVKGRDPVKDSTTPTGSYAITFKDRAATMSPEQGKNRSFWIQDVPHTQYFAPPFALHASYWHERFGEFVSAGCINLSPLDAERLFSWTDPPVPDEWQGATGAGASENGPSTIVVVRR